MDKPDDGLWDIVRAIAAPGFVAITGIVTGWFTARQSMRKDRYLSDDMARQAFNKSQQAFVDRLEKENRDLRLEVMEEKAKTELQRASGIRWFNWAQLYYGDLCAAATRDQENHTLAQLWVDAGKKDALPWKVAPRLKGFTEERDESWQRET